MENKWIIVLTPQAIVMDVLVIPITSVASENSHILSSHHS